MGSRKVAADSRKVEGLSLQVAREVANEPGLGSGTLNRRLRDRGVSFQDRGLPHAVRLAESKGLIEVEDLGPGKATRHYPCQPLPTPPPAGVGTPAANHVVVAGVPTGGETEQPLPAGVCSICGQLLHPALVTAGDTTHPTCSTKENP